jgi:hypothetical protein
MYILDQLPPPLSKHLCTLHHHEDHCDRRYGLPPQQPCSSGGSDGSLLLLLLLGRQGPQGTDTDGLKLLPLLLLLVLLLFLLVLVLFLLLLWQAAANDAFMQNAVDCILA